MGDFTIKTYKNLLKSLIDQGFLFQTLNNFIEKPGKKAIVLRHDVDRLPLNSLEFARIQAELEIKGTYYFRAVPVSWDEKVIRQIAEMGHEVGYHYEDLSFAWAKLKAEGRRRKVKGKGQKYRNEKFSDLQDRKTARPQDNGHLEKDLVDVAIKSFNKNLQRLRDIVPVKTICMHGSPMSKWDSRLLWKYYDYRDFGIIGEPYFDINFDEVLYLTDTGRRWDGSSVNIRDKATLRSNAENRRRDEETKRRRDKETKRHRDNGYANKSLSPQSLSPSVPQSYTYTPLLRLSRPQKKADCLTK